MQHPIRNLLYVHQGPTMGDVHIQYELNPSMHNRAMAANTNSLMLKADSTENSQSPAMHHPIRNLLHVHQGPTMGDVHM